MKHRALTFRVGILAAAIVGFAAPGSVRASGECVSTILPENAVLPGGSPMMVGDILTLCTTHAFTPVSSLHVSYVNGMPLRQMLSRRAESEGLPGGPPRPFMIFEKNADGRLQLYGFATSARGRLVTYTLADAPSTRAQRRAAAAAREARGPALAAVHAVMLAAKAH